MLALSVLTASFLWQTTVSFLPPLLFQRRKRLLQVLLATSVCSSHPLPPRRCTDALAPVVKVVYLADAWQARLLARGLANFVVPSSLTTSYPLGSGRKRPRREEDGGVGPAPKKWKR